MILTPKRNPSLREIMPNFEHMLDVSCNHVINHNTIMRTLFSLFVLTTFSLFAPLQMVAQSAAINKYFSAAARKTEAPDNMRVAFRARLSAPNAEAVISFDPRDKDIPFRVLTAHGENDMLWRYLEDWQNDPEPDNWLLADSFGPRLGDVEVAQTDSGYLLLPIWQKESRPRNSSLWDKAYLEGEVVVSPKNGGEVARMLLLANNRLNIRGVGRVEEMIQYWDYKTFYPYQVSLAKNWLINFKMRAGFNRTSDNHISVNIERAHIFLPLQKNDRLENRQWVISEHNRR